MPGGVISQLNTAVVQPWKDVLTTGHVKKKTNAKIDKLQTQMSDQAVQQLSHPLQDPFATALLLSPLLHGVARVGVGGVEASRALKAGEGVTGAVKAAAKRPESIPRVLKSGESETSLIPSRHAAVRLGQQAYDAALQRGLNKKPEGRVAAHAQKRIGGALNEEAQIAQKMRAAPAAMLDRAAGKLSKMKGRRREEQAALELTSVQTTPAEAAAYHLKQAADGVNVEQNTAVARLYQRVADRKLLTQDEQGHVVVDASMHPKLAKADAALARVQSTGDVILAEKGVRSPEVLAARRNAPGRIRAGATYEKPTPAKMGVQPTKTITVKGEPRIVKVPTVLTRAVAERDRIAVLHEKALEQEARWQETNRGLFTPSTKTPVLGTPLASNPFRNRVVTLGHAREVAQVKVDRLTAAAEKRVKPTGIVGGETARPGRGFVSARVSEKRLSRAEMAATRGPVVGAAKSPLDTKTFTGRSIEQGLVPKHVTAAASQHFRAILRFVNTDTIRRRALTTGSDVRRSSRDILVRNPDITPEKFSADMQQVLGRETSAVDTADEIATQEGLRAAHQMFLQDAIPGLRDQFAADRSKAVGVAAPKGYRWVDRNAIKGLTSQPAGPRGRIARSVDTVNSAVTAATVYFKVGHIGTRVLTNASTNIIQGSAAPLQMRRSYKLWEQLDEEQRVRAFAAAGQHGFASLPHEGTNLVARAATRGAQWWAKHADAMFRFNSLAYEARKAGYSTPAQFGNFLDHLESGGQGLSGAEWAKVSAAARRADREAISYGRLNEFEKRYITRAVWFYPWIKGSSLFTVRTAIEHPYKAAALGEAGVQGRKEQFARFGPTPTYEGGLLALTGGPNPMTTDLSTFSPFATASDVSTALTEPGALAGFANPVVGAAGQFVYGLNAFGSPSKTPYLDALMALGSATPEQQLAEAAAAQGQDQSQRMFPKSVLSTLLRYGGGPATPRRVHGFALNKAAARQVSGRR
jgi:hypothetical protein